MKTSKFFPVRFLGLVIGAYSLIFVPGSAHAQSGHKKRTHDPARTTEHFAAKITRLRDALEASFRSLVSGPYADSMKSLRYLEAMVDVIPEPSFKNLPKDELKDSVLMAVHQLGLLAKQLNFAMNAELHHEEKGVLDLLARVTRLSETLPSPEVFYNTQIQPHLERSLWDAQQKYYETAHQNLLSTLEKIIRHNETAAREIGQSTPEDELHRFKARINKLNEALRAQRFINDGYRGARGNQPEGRMYERARELVASVKEHNPLEGLENLSWFKRLPFHRAQAIKATLTALETEITTEESLRNPLWE